MRHALVALVGLSLAVAGCSRSGTVVVAAPQGGVVAGDGGNSGNGGGGGRGQSRVWVCHNGRWQDVAAPAADAHRGHGDRVSTAAQESRAAC